MTVEGGREKKQKRKGRRKELVISYHDEGFVTLKEVEVAILRCLE